MSLARSTLLVLALLASACKMSNAPAPTAAQSAAYVVMLGNDTVAVHQYTKVGDRIEGAVLQHLPRTQITRYVATMNPNGTPSLFEFNTRLPDGSIVPNGARSVTVTFVGDSAITQVQRDTLATARVLAKGAYPFLNNAFSLYALPIAALKAMNSDSAAMAVYGGGVRPTPVSVVRKGSNRYWIYVGGYPWEITTNDRGEVETADGARTTQHFVARRQSSVDIPAIMAMFAQREAAARPAATLSTRDTVNATVGSAQLWVDYGRPLARGRKVFGSNGVLGDTIWRTGANAATQFRTSVPLTIAGQTIPPGMYTLWTVAVPGRYQLIINKQTGQWGTAYNPAQDLLRVPLQATQLPQVVDRFTIVVDPAGANAGVLRLRWDTTELAVPFTTP
jgi:DUF2911 family protein